MAKSFHDFGGSGSLIAHLKERCDDIERVEIPQSLTVVKEPGHPTMAVGMVLHMIGNQRMFIATTDAELLLNDGILNPMGIRIEFARVAAMLPDRGG